MGPSEKFLSTSASVSVRTMSRYHLDSEIVSFHIEREGGREGRGETMKGGKGRENVRRGKREKKNRRKHVTPFDLGENFMFICPHFPLRQPEFYEYECRIQLSDYRLPFRLWTWKNYFQVTWGNGEGERGRGKGRHCERESF